MTETAVFAQAIGKVKAPEVPRVVAESYRPERPGVARAGQMGEAARAMANARNATEARQSTENAAHAPATVVGEAQKRLYEVAPNDVQAQEKFQQESTYLEHGLDELAPGERTAMLNEVKSFLVKRGIDPHDPELNAMAEEVLSDRGFRRELSGVYREIGANKFDGEGKAALDARLGEAKRKQLEAERRYKQKQLERSNYEKQKNALPDPDDITSQVPAGDKLSHAQVYAERTKRTALQEKLDRLQSLGKKASSNEVDAVARQLEKLNERLAPYDAAENIRSLQMDFQHKMDQCDTDLIALDGERTLAHNQYTELEPEVTGGKTSVDVYKKRVKNRLDKSMETALDRHFSKQEKGAEQIRAESVTTEAAKKEADINTRLDTAIGRGLDGRWADPSQMPEITFKGIHKKLEWAHKKLVDGDFYQLVFRDNHPDNVLNSLLAANPDLAALVNSDPALRDRARTMVVQKILQAREKTRAPGEQPIMKWHRNKLLDKPWANAAVKDMLTRSEQFRTGVAEETGIKVDPNNVTDEDAKTVKEKMKGEDKMLLFMLLMGIVSQGTQEPPRPQQ